MKTHASRRRILQSAAGAGFPFLIAHRAGIGAPQRALRIGGIGVGGKGWSDLQETSAENARVVALCDIDAARLARAAREYPEAKVFTDWRKLLEMEELDAVTVSTPDRMHAPAVMTAIRRGLHVYCQKPLTHSVWEARQIGLAAAKHQVVTQMGTQGRSGVGDQLTVELLRRKPIGRIRQIHLWTDRPIWPQGLERPPALAVPEGISWDDWIGVAPYRDYHDSLHPFKWRGWLDFGTGALGDIGCHAATALWDGLQLRAPTAIRSDGEPPNGETFPKASVIRFTFPATEMTGGEVELVWYDGGNLPDRKLFPFMPAEWEIPTGGRLIVGDEGVVFEHRLHPREKYADYSYPRIEGDNHYLQWTRACLDPSRKTLCPFDAQSGPLTEAILLGNIALRFPGRTLQWDAAAFTFPGGPEADKLLRCPYRKGWNIDGLG